jgi:hypothetical protein
MAEFGRQGRCMIIYPERDVEVVSKVKRIGTNVSNLVIAVSRRGHTDRAEVFMQGPTPA